MYKARIFLAAVVLFLFAFNANAADWVEVRSKNFTLVGDAGEKDIRRVATRLEQFRETIRLLFPKANLEKPVPVVVFVFSSHDSFRQYKPRRNGNIVDTVAGYFINRQEAAVIGMTEEMRGISPYEVVFHEYQHFILDNNFDDPPLWLNEGLAEFYSSFQMNDDGKTFRIGAPLARRLRTLQTESLMPLDKLFNYRRKYKERESEIDMLYAQSWALVHFLIAGNEGKRAAQFDKFLSQLNSGLPVEENFRQSFQTDYKTMEKELRQYVSKVAFPVLNFTLKNEINLEKDMQSRPMSAGETEFQLGRLQYYLGQPELAEKRLQKSINLLADFAPAQIWLGRIRTGQKRYDEAEKLLTRAVELDSKDYLAHSFQGLLSELLKKNDKAFNAYQTAIPLQPNLARTHADLASFYSDTERDNDAFIAYSKAMRLEPREAQYYLSSSHVALRLRRGLPAALQAQSYLRLQGWDEESSPYAAINSYFGFRLAKQPEKAQKVLEDAVLKLEAGVWGRDIFRYLRREISADELLKLATDNDKKTEAHGYIGFDLMLDEKTAEALPHYKWVQANGNKDFTEYSLVLAELKRLEAASSQAANKF